MMRDVGQVAIKDVVIREWVESGPLIPAGQKSASRKFLFAQHPPGLVASNDRTQSGVTRREVEETSKKRFAGALRIEPAVRTEPLALVADAGNYGF